MFRGLLNKYFKHRLENCKFRLLIQSIDKFTVKIEDEYTIYKVDVNTQEFSDIIYNFMVENIQPDNIEHTFWYKMLELNVDRKILSKEIINNSYKILARKYHPDKNGGCIVLMQLLNEAREEGLKVISK